MESNTSKSLIRYRKRRNVIKTRGESLTWDKFGGNLFTVQTVTGMEATGTWHRLLCGTWEPTTPMLKEKSKWKNHKDKSIDAGYRGGTDRSSEEAS